MKYQVIVGNVGTVLATNHRGRAVDKYNDYKKALETGGGGRADNVALLGPAGIEMEYEPPLVTRAHLQRAFGYAVRDRDMDPLSVRKILGVLYDEFGKETILDEMDLPTDHPLREEEN